jgi:peptide-methionine (S)-S-oxide reductase
MRLLIAYSFQGYAKDAYPWLIFLHASGVRRAAAVVHFPVMRTTFLVSCLILYSACSNSSAAATIPPPIVDEHTGSNSERVAVFAGGCFWGIEAVFEHVKGVKNATSGYSGGTAATAHYNVVSTGNTRHAESVQVVYDPSQITYGQLLQIFFSVAHDPTQLNRQGPDEGPQYRSAIFFANPEQQRIAQAYIDQLNKAKVFGKRIATEVVQLDMFYPAEAFHQDYVAHHPNDLYIVMNDAPKVERLRRQFAQWYRER